MSARSRLIAGGALAALVLGSGSLVSGQNGVGAGSVPRFEAVALRNLVDGVATGKMPGGEAWLDWNGHFMRAPDGKVFVPFTLTLDDVGEAFETIAMYVRVVPHGTGQVAGEVRVTGSDVAVPVSVPERQFGRGQPRAGEASARLGLMENELSAVKLPFEGFFVAETRRGPRTPTVRRALVVSPGDYDLYVAVRERLAGQRGTPKHAVMQRRLTVPDLAGDDIATSSIILAEQVTTIDRRLSAQQRLERPYAFGSAEVVPSLDASFRQDEVLSVVFFVYNVAVDKANLPDVTVQYRFRQTSQLGNVFGEMEPQRFSAQHTTPAFDVKAGRQLAVTQGLPLASFPPDEYELEIGVSDNLSGRTLQRSIAFRVGER
ncbi:MAG: hypothetical protein ACT4QD_18590 [Acidobacteriota bacterium]